MAKSGVCDEDLRPTDADDAQAIANKHRSKRLLWLRGATIIAAVGVAAIAYFAYVQWQRRQTQTEQQAQVFFAQAGTAAAQKQFGQCVRSAKRIPQHSTLFSQAQTLLEHCQSQQTLATAEMLANQGRLQDAVIEASKVAPNSPSYSEAQRFISQRADHLLNVANRYYQMGKLPQAKATAKAIPETHLASKQVGVLITRWDAEWAKNQEHLQTAEYSLSFYDWWGAIDYAKRITTGSPYWRQKANQVIQKAQNEINKLPPMDPSPTPLPTL